MKVLTLPPFERLQIRSKRKLMGELMPMDEEGGGDKKDEGVDKTSLKGILRYFMTLKTQRKKIL